MVRLSFGLALIKTKITFLWLILIEYFLYDAYSITYFVCLSIHDSVCFTTYGCCHPCLLERQTRWKTMYCIKTKPWPRSSMATRGAKGRSRSRDPSSLRASVNNLINGSTSGITSNSRHDTLSLVLSQSPKFYSLVLQLWGLYCIVIGGFIKLSVQTFQPLIIIYT